MRKNIFVSLLACALTIGAALSAGAQQDPNQEDVRGAFLSTRVTVAAGSGSTGSSSTGRSTRRQSGRTTTTTKSSGSKGTTTAKSTGKVGAGTGGTKSTPVKSNNGGGNMGGGTIPVNSYASKPIGLGYSLYMREASGDPVRIDPARTFRAGDRIRISLETNTDGYLYVFHTENNGEPQMLYPNARLDAGENFVEAHVPYELPWSGEAPENRWFVFDSNPANERLYIVLAREPLPGVPTGEQLTAYCRDKGNNCAWRPATDLWSRVRVNAEGKVIIDSKATTYGQKQTAIERDATTRGLGLAPASPEPSIVRMNASSNAGVLITALDLNHQ